MTYDLSIDINGSGPTITNHATLADAEQALRDTTASLSEGDVVVYSVADNPAGDLYQSGSFTWRVSG